MAKDLLAQALYMLDQLKRLFLDGFDSRSISSESGAYRDCIGAWDELQVRALPPSSTFALLL